MYGTYIYVINVYLHYSRITPISMEGSITHTHSCWEVESPLLTGSSLQLLAPNCSTWFDTLADLCWGESRLKQHARKVIEVPILASGALNTITWSVGGIVWQKLWVFESKNWNSSKNFKRRQVRFSMIRFDIDKILAFLRPLRFSRMCLEDWLEKEPRYFSNTSRPCLQSLCKERSSKASARVGRNEGLQKLITKKCQQIYWPFGLRAFDIFRRLFQGWAAALSMLWFGRLPRRCPCLWSCRGLPGFDRMSWKPLRQIAALQQAVGAGPSWWLE